MQPSVTPTARHYENFPARGESYVQNQYFYQSYDNSNYKKEQNYNNKQEDTDYENLITEDDEPVDNLFSEREQKLLTMSIHDSWDIDRPFMSLANVGIYDWDTKKPPVVPDVFLSMDVIPPDDAWKKKNRTYMLEVYKKPPEIVIEIVSDTKKKEAGKKKIYADLGIKHYVIHDPGLHNGKNLLEVYLLKNDKYYKVRPKKGIYYFEDPGIGITLKKHVFHGQKETWLRWCFKNGKLLDLGKKLAELANKRAQLADKKAQLADKKAQEANKKAQLANKKAQEANKKAQEERERAQLADKKAQEERERSELVVKKFGQHLLSTGTSKNKIAELLGCPLADIEKMLG